MDKLVSIISPCYNGEKYLKKYLDSILEQTYSKIELILVNDASTDLSENIIESYIPKFEEKEYSLIYIKQLENKGQAAAINCGLKIFSGSYITWMDSDDIYYSNAIEKKVQFLENNLEYDYVLNQGEIVDKSNLDKTINVLKREKPLTRDNLFKDLIDESNVVFCPGAIMVRASILKEAIPDLAIYESREGQNWQLMLPLAYSYKCGYLNEVLFKYVIHSDSHSREKRTYQEWIERRNNFVKLQSETINRIVTMPKDEKKYWCKYSYSKQLKEKYLLALKYGKMDDYKKYRKELIESNVKLPPHSSCIFYLLYCLVRKARREN